MFALLFLWELTFIDPWKFEVQEVTFQGEDFQMFIGLREGGWGFSAVVFFRLFRFFSQPWILFFIFF